MSAWVVPPTGAGFFFSNLQSAHLRINSFSWHNRVYHPIVCGAEQNRPTLNANTSELEDTRALSSWAVVFFNCLAWKKWKNKRCSSGGGGGAEGERSIFVLVLLPARQMRRAECTTWSSAPPPRGNRAWTVLREWAILSMTQICYLFSPPTIYLFILPRAGLCVSLSANTSAWPCGLFVCFSFFPTCPPFHHRSGISSLWSVWRYWLVTRARCCVCSMMRGSSSRARLTPLSGTRTV